MAAESPATDVLQRLFRVPPPQFVAERNRIAKALKAEGAKDLAAAVSAVRRPGVSDWALDVTASEHPEEVAELVEAAHEVIDAQEAAMEGRDAGDLRVRLKLLRVCTTAVAALANGVATRFDQTGAGSSVTDITTRLAEITGNRAALDLLGRGLLGAEDPGVADPFQLATAAEPVEERPPPTRPRRAAPPTGVVAPRRPSGPSADERRRRRAQLVEAKKALVAAEKAADAAERSVADHERVLAKAQERVAEAEARLDALRAEVAAANDQLRSAREELERAGRTLTTARNALHEAERAESG